MHDRVYAVEFDPAASSVVASVGEGTVVAFDARTGVTTALFDGAAKLVRSVHFDPSSHRIIAASWDGTARVWDASPTYRRPSKPGELPVAMQVEGKRLVRMSPDGRRCVYIPVDGGPPELFELGRRVGQLEGHAGRVWSARFVHAAREILTAGEDGSVRLWDATTGRLLQTFRSFGAGSSRYFADADSDGSVVVAGAGDGSLRFWDLATSRQIWTLQAHRSGVVGVGFDHGAVITRDKAGDTARWELPAPATVISSCAGQRCGTVLVP